jgi:hypothetical protein
VQPIAQAVVDRYEDFSPLQIPLPGAPNGAGEIAHSCLKICASSCMALSSRPTRIVAPPAGPVQPARRRRPRGPRADAAAGRLCRRHAPVAADMDFGRGPRRHGTLAAFQSLAFDA